MTRDYYQLDFDCSAEKWITASDALRETIKIYAVTRGVHISQAEIEAIAALQYRLKCGLLKALSTDWTIYIEEYDGDQLKHKREYSSDIYPEIIAARLIPLIFWRNLAFALKELSPEGGENAGWLKAKARVDWIAGDFEYRLGMTVKEGKSYRNIITIGRAHSIFLNCNGLPGHFAESQGGYPAGIAQGDNSLVHGPVVQKPATSKDLRPPIPAAKLQRWWAALTEEAKALPHDDILQLVRTEFPANRISRAQVRELAGPRKRGPKGIRRKLTA